MTRARAARTFFAGVIVATLSMIVLVSCTTSKSSRPKPAPGVTASSTTSTMSTTSTTMGPVSYVVKRGDSLTTIAKRFRVAVSAVVSANHLANPDRLVAGDTLRIPLAQTFSLAIAPSTAPQGQRFTFTLTQANPFENIVFTVRSPTATFSGPPHQASSEGAVNAAYRTGTSDPVGTYTVTAHGDKGTDVNATFVLTAATTTTS